MKINNKLDEILNQASKVKILRFLFNEKDEHTGRAIARAIKMSVSTTYTSLQEMKNIGIISVRRKGNAILYTLRENNYFVKNLIIPLFDKEKAVYGDIIALIKRILLKEKKVIISIMIYGSVAKSQETTRSDIDLAIITKKELDKNKINKLTDHLSIAIAKEFSVALSPYILTKAELIKKYSRKVPIIKSILADNKLIYGEPIERILA